ncbi:MAG TPA: TIR domain-containing protein [Sphingomonas sp.]|nr:TIR domain-containing protein [Sphingomonas sp.]
MPDIFISYARSTAPVAKVVADTLRAQGCAVWWDEELPAHRAYADVIEEHLRAAKAVIVLWSADAIKSHWVRAEADLARAKGTLIQVRMDDSTPPLPFNQIQCVDLAGWDGRADAAGWRKVVASVAALLGAPTSAAVASVAAPAAKLLAVLAFDNLSNDPELDYFSDGVSEEILYTVARAKGLRVIGKASSFQFRGPAKAPRQVASALHATHILDGSVRRAGDNIRINVELTDTESLETLWSERFDRALTDIFALQDEIAAAVATSLDHHFSPTREALAIDPAAYDFYLQAQAIYAQDMTWSDQARCVDLLEKAVSRAPNFAQAWGRLALYRKGEAAIAAAERGLELDPSCATSLAALAMTRPPFARNAEKLELAEQAYLLTPDDQLVAGVYNIILISLGLIARACQVSEERLARDPLSPMVAGGLAIVYRSAGRAEEAAAIAERALAAFPSADYVRFIRGVLAIYDDDIDCAAAMAETVSPSAEVAPLQVLVMFIRAVAAMAPADRAIAVGGFLHRQQPRSFIVDIGLAAAMGEPDLAMEHLLAAIDAGRPIEFTPDNDGRAATEATVTTGLFMPNCEVLRRDPRFAEVCVRLGLYDCWRDTGRWPDCVAEVAPLYDLKAACTALAGTVAPYSAAR